MQREFTGELCEFFLGAGPNKKPLPRRQYIVVNLPYGEARRFFKPDFYDYITGKGEQRRRIDSHVRKLLKEMRVGNFTPTPWAAGLRQSHLKHATITDAEATVTVDEKRPLPLLDGGHRNETLGDLWDAADEELRALIDEVTITVLIHLDPNTTKADFQNLQLGKAVDRSLLKAQQRQTGRLDPKKQPFEDMAWDVMIALNAHPDSHLKDEVRIVGEAGRVNYSSITTFGGSDIGTSLGGAAKIALYEGFRDRFPQGDDYRRAAKQFLVDCHVRAWKAFFEHGQQEEYTNPGTGAIETMPAILGLHRMLRPTKLQGGKAGTGLVIMLGNMLAFRMLAVKKKTEIAPRDEKALVEAAEQILDIEMRGGGSGHVKRELTGQFVREYFRDTVRNGDDDPKKLADIDGVPRLLVELLTASTLGVSGRIEDDNMGRPDPVDTDPEWTEEVVESHGRRRPKVKDENKAAVGFMG